MMMNNDKMRCIKIIIETYRFFSSTDQYLQQMLRCGVACVFMEFHRKKLYFTGKEEMNLSY